MKVQQITQFNHFEAERNSTHNDEYDDGIILKKKPQNKMQFGRTNKGFKQSQFNCQKTFRLIKKNIPKFKIKPEDKLNQKLTKKQTDSLKDYKKSWQQFVQIPNVSQIKQVLKNTVQNFQKQQNASDQSQLKQNFKEKLLVFKPCILNENHISQMEQSHLDIYKHNNDIISNSDRRDLSLFRKVQQPFIDCDNNQKAREKSQEFDNQFINKNNCTQKKVNKRKIVKQCVVSLNKSIDKEKQKAKYEKVDDFSQKRLEFSGVEITNLNDKYKEEEIVQQIQLDNYVANLESLKNNKQLFDLYHLSQLSPCVQIESYEKILLNSQKQEYQKVMRTQIEFQEAKISDKLYNQMHNPKIQIKIPGLLNAFHKYSQDPRIKYQNEEKKSLWILN